MTPSEDTVASNERLLSQVSSVNCYTPRPGSFHSAQSFQPPMTKQGMIEDNDIEDTRGNTKGY